MSAFSEKDLPPGFGPDDPLYTAWQKVRAAEVEDGVAEGDYGSVAMLDQYAAKMPGAQWEFAPLEREDVLLVSAQQQTKGQWVMTVQFQFRNRAGQIVGQSTEQVKVLGEPSASALVVIVDDLLISQNTARGLR